METIKLKISNRARKLALTKWSKNSVNKVVETINSINSKLESTTSLQDIYDIFAYMHECWIGGDVEQGMPTKCLWFFLKQNNISNKKCWKAYENKVIAFYKMLNNHY